MLSQSCGCIACSKWSTRPTSLSPETVPWILNSQMSSFMELSPWCRVVSFLWAVTWQFGSVNIFSSSAVDSAHVGSIGLGAFKIRLILWQFLLPCMRGQRGCCSIHLRTWWTSYWGRGSIWLWSNPGHPGGCDFGQQHWAGEEAGTSCSEQVGLGGPQPVLSTGKCVPWLT